MRGRRDPGWEGVGIRTGRASESGLGGRHDPDWEGVGIGADWTIGWGRSPTVLASKTPKFELDLQLSHGPC